MNPTPEFSSDIKEQIITAGRTIFARYGFQKATMDDIAQAARKGKSSLYHYFKSKEEIFKAVIEKEAGEFKSEIERAVALETDSQKKLRAYILTRMQALRRLANLYTTFQKEYLESHHFIEELRREYDQYEIDMFKQILHSGVLAGIFQLRDLDLTAYAMMIAQKGLEYQWAIQKDQQLIEKSVDSLLEVFFNGILKR
ncbi:MAG: TetR/AcrR family transcriptional regulator [Firmicutes bacterium]|nr:TetR/AcrR family transcriptional regulator [Bacillota bacterium]